MRNTITESTSVTETWKHCLQLANDVITPPYLFMAYNLYEKLYNQYYDDRFLFPCNYMLVMLMSDYDIIHNSKYTNN